MVEIILIIYEYNGRSHLAFVNKDSFHYIGWKQRLVTALLNRGISASADDSLKNLIDLVLTIPIQSELALEGDAIVADVLSGKDFYSDDWSEKLTGTMPDNGGEDQEISAKADEKTPSEGYHDGTGVIKIADAEQAKIIAENIKNGVTVLGVEGSLQSLDTSDATATVNDIFKDKTAYVNGSKLIGLLELYLSKNTAKDLTIKTIDSIGMTEDHSGMFVSGQAWTGGYPNSPIDSDIYHHQVIGHVSTTYYLMVSTGRIYRYAPSGNYLMAETGHEWRTYKRIGNYWILDSYALKGGNYGMSNYTALDRCKSDVYTSDTFATVLMAETL